MPSRKMYETTDRMRKTVCIWKVIEDQKSDMISTFLAWAAPLTKTGNAGKGTVLARYMKIGTR